MNFLAHCFLSGGDPLVELGNLSGDFVKGRAVLAELAPAVRRGVLLHRRIDSFTDQHEAVREACALLRPAAGRFAGVVIDVVFDHLLATEWAEHHEASLRGYLDGLYLRVLPIIPMAPITAQDTVRRIIEADLMGGYQSVDELLLTLQRMSRRLGERGFYADASVQLFCEERSAVLECFHQFFPAMQREAARFLSEADE